MKEEVWKTTHISSYHEVSNYNKINIFVLNENKTIIANTISEAEHITGVTRMKIRTSINDINKSGRYSSKLNSYVSFTIQTI